MFIKNLIGDEIKGKETSFFSLCYRE